jgi:hypothetical protein
MEALSYSTIFSYKMEDLKSFWPVWELEWLSLSACYCRVVDGLVLLVSSKLFFIQDSERDFNKASCLGSL